MVKNIQKLLIQEISSFQTEQAQNKEIFKQETAGQNEFLFFIKPELTVKSNEKSFGSIIELILNKINAHKLNIRNIRLLNAPYLEKHSVIAQHYGVINKLSSDIHRFISSESIKKFEEIFKTSFEKSNVFGSIEFMNRYPYFTSTGLAYLWQNSPTVKLGGGTYTQKLSFEGETVYLINGFHPRQLEHFIAPGKYIITMTLTGDTDWKIARNRFIGKTNPQDAEPESIRRELLDNQQCFGLESVSSSWNGVHLSAGPIEGLVELARYNSDFEKNILSVISDYQLGKQLIQAFGTEISDKIPGNPNVIMNGIETTLFDLTEEKNSSDCISLLKEAKIG